MKLTELFSIVCEDVKYYSKPRLSTIIRHILFDMSLRLLLMYRISRYCYLNKLHYLNYYIEYLEYKQTSCRIDCKASIGKKFRIAHPTGIIIGAATIGDNVTIWQNTTLGSDGKTNEYPKIGDNVKIYANCIIVGDIQISNNSIIKAASIINRDV